jgi:hypothetical protein
MPKQFFFKKIIFFFEGPQLRNKSIILVFIFLRIRHFPDLHWKQIVAIDQWLKRLFLLNLLRRSLFLFNLKWRDSRPFSRPWAKNKRKERKVLWGMKLQTPENDLKLKMKMTGHNYSWINFRADFTTKECYFRGECSLFYNHAKQKKM